MKHQVVHFDDVYVPRNLVLCLWPSAVLSRGHLCSASSVEAFDDGV